MRQGRTGIVGICYLPDKKQKPVISSPFQAATTGYKSTGQSNLALARAITSEKTKNADTCHPPHGSLAVPANHSALTKVDIHDHPGLAMPAPQTQVPGHGGLISCLLRFLAAIGANVKSILYAQYNSLFCFVQVFFLTFLTVSLNIHNVSRRSKQIIFLLCFFEIPCVRKNSPRIHSRILDGKR